MCKQKGPSPAGKEKLCNKPKWPSSEPRVAAAKEPKSIGERASPYQEE